MPLLDSNFSRSAVSFREQVLRVHKKPLAAVEVRTLQANIGYRCNLSCRHCHISAGPSRREVMPWATMELVLAALSSNPAIVLDITGGAPELNPHFREFVKSARRIGRQVIVRTNLSVFFEPGMDDLPEFYRDQNVELVASLPCYLEQNVDDVRGAGTYKKCIDAILHLNALGYGRETTRKLNLVYNPAGPGLPPAQSALERDYKRELMARYGISFTQLYAFANMPIGRFRDTLVRTRGLDAYQSILACSFNPLTLENIMCRRLINVRWDGRLFDCDFNQVLGIGMNAGTPAHIGDFDLAGLSSRRIAMDDHCFGCTASQGST